MSLVVSFAGQIGSGKSSISRALAATFGWPRAAFGDYLRKLAAERGLNPDDREVLQDLGQSLVTQNSQAFCRAVLLDGGFTAATNLVVDGVRHVEIQRDIAQVVAPSICRLIYLDATGSTRLTRVSDRADGQTDFNRAENHVVESQLLRALPNLADAVVDAGRDFSIVLRECESLMRSWLSR